MLGKSAQLIRDNIEWQIPNGEQVDFVFLLLKQHVMTRIGDLKGCGNDLGTDEMGEEQTPFMTSANCLRLPCLSNWFIS